MLELSSVIVYFCLFSFVDFFPVRKSLVRRNAIALWEKELKLLKSR